MRLLLLITLPAVGWSCSCVVSPLGSPACKAASSYAVIFTGVVSQIVEPVSTRTPFGGTTVAPRAHFRISEIFKGLDKSTSDIELLMGSFPCTVGFERGVEYIVYASRDAHTGEYSASICSPTRPVTSAAEDLAYFHHLADSPPLGEIRGIALDSAISKNSPVFA